MPAKSDKPDETTGAVAVTAHGARILPAVAVDSYNLEAKDGDGFVGDRTTNAAFREILDDWRALVGKLGDDPLGTIPTAELSKKRLDRYLDADDPETIGLVHEAIGGFAQEFAGVIRRFLRLRIGATPSGSRSAAAFARAA